MKRALLKQLFSVLEPYFRKQAFMLQCFLLIGVLFESVGLGMIVPLIKIVTDTSLASQSGPSRWIPELFGNVSANQKLWIVIVFFILFYIVKTIFISLLVWKQSSFIQGLSQNISTRLYRRYLFQPYAFFIENNTAILMKQVVSEVHSFTGFVQSFLFLQTELAVLLGIVVTLLVLEPVSALLIFCFVGGVSYLLFYFSRKKISAWGKDRQQYDGLRSKTVLQGLSGVTEVKLYHREDRFTDVFDGYNKVFYGSQKRIQFLSLVQRPYLELVMISSMVLLVFALTMQGRTLQLLLPSLGLFLFASLRLLPSANRIIGSLQTMRFTEPAVTLICDELGQEEPIAFPDNLYQKIEIKKSLRLTDINYHYPNSTQNILKGINLVIPLGTVVGITGHNGSGKTTLINILTGLLEPSSGQVWADEIDTTRNIRALQKQIGYVPQHIFLTDDTLKANIAFGLEEEEIDPEKLATAIATACLQEVIDQLPMGINTEVGERGIKLSGGQKQRVGIARALYQQPQILVLDEGTSSQDGMAENGLMESILRLKKMVTVVMVTHSTAMLGLCDRVYVMENGKIRET
ncbi:MAG: ABC transporter ATP-binding protein [Bacteroidota bacterium]